MRWAAVAAQMEKSPAETSVTKSEAMGTISGCSTGVIWPEGSGLAPQQYRFPFEMAQVWDQPTEIFSGMNKPASAFNPVQVNGRAKDEIMGMKNGLRSKRRNGYIRKV